MYDQGTQGLNRYSYALNNPFRYNDPTGHAATAAYRAQTPYNLAPYAGTFDTGNNLADMALGVAGGVWNLGASLLNMAASLVGGASETGYTAVETRYNDLTYRLRGDDGFTGNGFAEDMNALVFATTSMPIEVAAFQQSLSVWKTYSSSMVVNAGEKVKATLASERGAAYSGWFGKASKRTEIIVRRTNAAEAAQMADVNGLVPKPGSRSAKWVSQGKAQTSLRLKGHERTVIMEVESGTTEWLSQQAVNYDDVIGEASLPSGVLTKSDESGAFGIGVDLIHEFNAKVRRVIIE